MAGRTRLGVLTPSSNTVLEPAYAAMLAGTGVTAHFARFRVTAIDLGAAALAQFDPAPILAAAELLADARVASLCWSGTSAGWLGLDSDRRLCAAIEARTGIPACTATLGLIEAMQGIGARRVGLVTPYLAAVQARILDTFAAAGLDCVAERHLDDPGNFSFAAHGEARIAALVRDVAAGSGGARPDAVAIFCTNFRGAAIAAGLEAELGLPVFDSTAAGLRAGLLQAALAPSLVAGWGSLFSTAGPSGGAPDSPAASAGRRRMRTR